MNTRKMVLTALFVAIGIVLPQVVHLIGGPSLGTIIQPMHIPVFIGAMLLGPAAGVIIAVLSISVGVMLGMPPLFIASYMIFELIVYAVASGWLRKKLNINVYISYIIAKVAGILIAFIVIQILFNVFGMSFPPAFTSIAIFYPGILALVLQLFIVPSSVLLLEKEIVKHEGLS